MSHAIVWLDSVTASIAEFYQQAVSESGHEVAALNRALAQIIEALERDPAHSGESRSGHLRVLIEVPLVIDYKFFDEERIAVVLKARYCPGPQSD